MPHGPRPVMNTNDQITTVEPTIKIPDWRSASPKNRNTRRLHTSRTIVPVKRPISPVAASHSRGIASSSFTARSSYLPQSSLLDHQDLRVRGEERLREDVVERADAEESDHDRLVDRAPDA